MIPLVAGFILLLVGASSVPRSHGHLQWSESTTVPSPNRAWQVEVHPIFTLNSDENKTPVSLRENDKATVWHLFTLQRDADVYWSPDSSKLLVVNEPLSGTNQLLLFSVKSLSGGNRDHAPGQLDEVVKEHIHRRIGEKRNIDFYLPQFVTWKGSDIVLAVGGATDKGIGPMTSYCYGVVIDRNSLRIQSILSGKNLKEKFGAKCQIFP